MPKLLTMTLYCLNSSGILFAVMELSDLQVVMYQMKDEWRFVSLVNGKRFVTTIGVRMKQEWCVDN